jgi:AcrR family transcriptional regulator
MRAADRRTQLLAVASRLLSDPSTVGASMDDIAAAAGVTKPVLYRHFPSKRALVHEVLSGGIGRLRGSLADAVADATSSRDMVERGFIAFFEHLEAEPGAYELLFAGSAWTQAGFAEELVEFQTAMADLVSQLIDLPGAGADLRRFYGAALVGMCDHAARQWLQAPLRPSPRQAGIDLAELAWVGLRGLSPRA